MIKKFNFAKQSAMRHEHLNENAKKYLFAYI